MRCNHPLDLASFDSALHALATYSFGYAESGRHLKRLSYLKIDAIVPFDIIIGEDEADRVTRVELFHGEQAKPSSNLFHRSSKFVFVKNPQEPLMESILRVRFMRLIE